MPARLPEEDLMAHGDITHIDIPVGDTGAARAFYSALFGWDIAELRSEERRVGKECPV